MLKIRLSQEKNYLLWNLTEADVLLVIATEI